MNTLDNNKLYTSSQIIDIISLRKWEDLKLSGKLVWVTDNTQGQKLYKLMY